MQRLVDDLVTAGADFVVAITHLPLGEDSKLVSSVRGINLVIGNNNYLILQKIHKVDVQFIYFVVSCHVDDV